MLISMRVEIEPDEITAVVGRMKKTERDAFKVNE